MASIARVAVHMGIGRLASIATQVTRAIRRTASTLNSTAAGRLPGQSSQFVQEGLLVLKVAVNGGEPHVGDLIDAAQTVHQILADLGRSDFAVRGVGNAR